MSTVKDLLSTDPWDVKEIDISLHGEIGSEKWLRFVVFSDDYLNIYEGPSENPLWGIEDIPLDVARRIRDFLIYALK